MESKSSVRWIILCVLVIQTSVTVLLFRYSLHGDGSEPYLATSVVFLTELAKYMLSMSLLLAQTRASLPRAAAIFTEEIMLKPRQTCLLGIPAFLYTLQNNLLIIALTNLDAATYQVTYQLKILTTAGFSVLLLHKELSVRQWLSLLILTAGVALVQLPDQVVPSGQDQLTGLGAVLVACFSSGFAGVFYEKLLKSGAQPSIVIRNLQLGIFSILLSGTAMLAHDYAAIMQKGLLQGYTQTVYTVILLQSVGGLVVAASIKYADNILKGFATSISILVSGSVSWLVLGDLHPGPTFLLGTALVLAASGLYCYQPKLSSLNKSVLQV